MDWEKLMKQYREEAERYKLEADEAKAELKDFITFSRQVEAELDNELNAAKVSLSRRDKEVVTLTQERDRYKEEAQQIRAEKYSMELKITEELHNLRSEKEALQSVVHKLEQKNDDLERELRITYETLKDTEKRLNEELEMRALLTTELDTKEELKDRCQRLEDEVRDLKLDGLVKDAKLSKCLNFKQPNGVPIAAEKYNSGNLTQQKSRQDEGTPHPSKAVKNGLISYEKYDGCSQDGGRKRLSTEANLKGIGSRVNALPPSLASSVSPVIVNLLETVQALEEKLLLLHPERRTTVENGFGSTNRRH